MNNELKGKDKEDLKKEIENLQKAFITNEILTKKEPKITEILKKFKNKLIESKPNLFFLPNTYEFNSDEYKELFIYEKNLPSKNEKDFSVIYDCLNFICYNENDMNNSKINDYYQKKLSYLFSILKEKGALLILLDQNYLESFLYNFIITLGDNYKTKLFINFYFLDTHNFLFLFTIQKMTTSEQPIILTDLKILITDYISNVNPKIYGSTTIGEFNYYLKDPILKMQSYHLQRQLNYRRLKIIHPGEYFQMRLKVSPIYSDISFIITICDNSTNIGAKNRKTVAILITYEISQEFLYSNSLSYDAICQQLDAGRIIILESSILNPTNINVIYLELKDEVQMMKPEGFNEEISIKLWEDKNQKILIFEDGNYLVRDNEDKKYFMRQLINIKNKNLPSMILSKIKVKFVSKSKINNSSTGNTYYPMETQTKLKNKGVIECIDELNILGFYEKFLLCMAFYMNLDNLPYNTIKIMDIGAGAGVMSFYFYKLFKGNCEIDNIEKDKDIYNIGTKYFGLKNYDFHGNRVNWFLEDVETYLDKVMKKGDKKYENKIGFYDLIFNEISDIEPKEEIVPSKKFFTDEYFENIIKLLKPYGIYTVNIMGKHYKNIYENYLKLEKFFPSIFAIQSESGLAYIFLCFKEKLDLEKYDIKFQKNKQLMEKNDIVEISIIKPIENEVITRIQNIDEIKKKLEEKSKSI